jgi:heme oxygenase
MRWIASIQLQHAPPSKVVSPADDSALELALSEHANNPALSAICDPSLLARGPPLAEDISHMLSLIPQSELDSPDEYDADLRQLTAEELSSTAATALPPFPVHTCFQTIFSHPPPALQAYLTQIQELSRSNAALLLAHAYVRYLGDLSGGQIIGGRIKRAYNLSGIDGTKFFDFSAKGERSGFEAAGEDETLKKRMTDIKDWFRRGMDDGVVDDRELKGEWELRSCSNQALSMCNGGELFQTKQADTVQRVS